MNSFFLSLFPCLPFFSFIPSFLLSFLLCNCLFHGPFVNFEKISNLGIPGGSDSKESACNAGDPGSIPGSGRSPGDGNGCPLQYSCLKNSMDRGVWQAIVHGIAKTQLSDWHFHFSLFQILKKKKATRTIQALRPSPHKLSKWEHFTVLFPSVERYFSFDMVSITSNTCMHPKDKDPSPKYNHHTNPSSQKFNTDMVQPDPQANQISPAVLTKPPFPSQSRILPTNMYSTSLSSLISFLQSGTIPPEQFFVSQVLQSFSFRPFILKGDSTFSAAPWPKTMHSW